MTGFDVRMAALRERFRSRAESDRQALRAAMERSDLDEVRRLAHGLAGSAGTFGFHAVSESASSLEEAVERGEAVEQIRDRQQDLLARLAEV